MTIDLLASARRVLAIEAAAVADLAERLDDQFEAAVQAILKMRGRLIVTGMGKSGIVGHKIAATLMSTGTPSATLHPGEAYHGDLGMITRGDLVLAISNSGETDEVLKLLPFVRDNGNTVISMTGNPSSTLARASQWHLDVGVAEEACSLRLAPTSSTTATLAMGDALAIALMDARGFSPEDFARFHPGGSLGKRLLSRVEGEMSVPPKPISATTGFREILGAVTSSGLGVALVSLEDGIGLITDGDLRRAVETYGPAVFSVSAESLATPNPVTVAATARVEDALAIMDHHGIACLLVADGDAIVGVMKK